MLPRLGYFDCEFMNAYKLVADILMPTNFVLPVAFFIIYFFNSNVIKKLGNIQL